MKLQKLLQGIEILETTVDFGGEVCGVSYDSRATRPGELFVAMTGFAADGHAFIPEAASAGAVCVLCEIKPEGEFPYILVKNSRRALAVLGANWYGHPAGEMTILAVTGTNGKTTTTYLLKDILEQVLGATVGLIGTNQNMIGPEVLTTERTTPESFELQGLFRRMRDGGCTHVVMEVSSHALSLDRVYGVEFALGIFTNLTQDHLDFHGSMEEYCDAKALLFQMCRHGVYNADDSWAERLMQNATCQRISYGCKTGAELLATGIALSSAEIAFTAVHAGQSTAVRVGIPGGFMVYNALGVLGGALALGIPLEDSVRVLSHSAHVKGRVEVVPTPGRAYTILIDYAHSPDALENVLTAVRGFAKGRVVAVFGCGGDRDTTKRPKMGAIAARLADFSVVTSDNPRTENPRTIINDIIPGMAGAEGRYTVVENRGEAIRWAMDHAGEDDVIVLCGKGHETYQEINHEKIHLDEREVVAAHLAKC